MECQLPESAIDMADEISLGELFLITTQEKNVHGILRIVSYCKGHLMIKPNKTTEEKNLLICLIDLVNEIGPDLFDKAFAVQREYLANKSPMLPGEKGELNTDRRRAQLIRNARRTQ